jgi:pimeloyl-ACP methyl ester carboxylesterase
MPELQTSCSETGESISIYYELYGNPESPNKLLLTIGFMCTVDVWNFLKPAFNAIPNWQFCIYDNRGCGRSRARPGKYTTDLMAQDAFQLLEHLKWTDLEKVHVGGMSMGAMISQKLAIKLLDKGKLGSMLLCCSGLRYLRGPEIIGQIARWFFFDFLVTYGIAFFFVAIGVALLGVEMIISIFIRVCFSSWYLKAAPSEEDIAHLVCSEQERKAYENQKPKTNLELYEMIYKLNARKWIDPRAELITSQWFALVSHHVSKRDIARLRTAEVPIKVQMSTHDFLVPLSAQQEMARALHADVLVMEGGHKAAIEYSSRFIQSFKGHLERAKNSPRCD